MAKNKRKGTTNKRKTNEKKKKKNYNGARRKPYKEERLYLLKYKNKTFKEKIKVFFTNRIRVIKFDMKKFKNKFKYGTFKDRLLILLMLILIAGFSCFIAFAIYVIVSAPDMSEVALYKNNSTVLYTLDGEEFARLGTENREKITYDEIPEVLIDAIVATEDSRFFQHNGIDIARFSKAVFGQLAGHSDAGGGSTLTMQVAKTATGNTESHGIKGIVRKFTDIYTSVFVLEKKYTKEQIMSFYVNLPNLGANIYGVEQASQNYFGKSVSELTLSEAALIAGLFQAPNAYNPFTYPNAAEARRNTVLNLMYRHGYINADERDAAKAIPVSSMVYKKDTKQNIYQGYIDTVVAEVQKRTGHNPYQTPMKIYTNLDTKRQDVINDVYAGKIDKDIDKNWKWKNEYSQAGIAIVDVKTGALVAVGAGRNKTGLSAWNFATQERRHPGSAAKPVVDYGPAVEYLGWGTGSMVIDDNYTYTGGGSIKNWDRRHLGIMTARIALASSRNIPALLTFKQTTHEQKLEFAQNLNWKLETDGNGHVLETCSIGGFNGVTPVEMAAAYATFARGGTYIEPYSFTSLEYTETGDIYTVKPEKHQAMSESTAYIITQMLRTAVSGGYVSVRNPGGTDIASKTGTSTVDASAKKYYGWKNNPIGDSWQVAYSPDYAIATWYGYKNRAKDYYLTSAEGGRARKVITKQLTKHVFKKNSHFKKPKSVVSVEIEKETDPVELASKYTPKDLKSTEYFKRGTQPTTVSERFKKLENVSNLTYNSTSTTVTLNWNPAPTPKVITDDYLKNYFNDSKIYKKWADKYYKERLKYNDKNLGKFGYRIYGIDVNGESVDLGFTSGTSFTTALLPNIKSMMVKTCYKKFASNQSSGVTVEVNPNATNVVEDPDNPTTSTTTVTKPTINKDSLFISYKRNSSCTTLEQFNNLGSTVKDKINLTYKGESVINDAVCDTNPDYLDSDENPISSSSLTNNETYYAILTCKYQGVTATEIVTIKPSC